MMRLDATRISTNRALLVSLGRALMTSISCEHTCIINTRNRFLRETALDRTPVPRKRLTVIFMIDEGDIYASCVKYSEHASFYYMNWDVKVVNTKLHLLLKYLNYNHLVFHLSLYCRFSLTARHGRSIYSIISHDYILNKAVCGHRVRGMTWQNTQ